MKYEKDKPIDAEARYFDAQKKAEELMIPMTKEKTLIDVGIYNDLVNFKPVSLGKVMFSMHLYASQQVAEKEKEIERLKELIEKLDRGCVGSNSR